MGMFIVYWFGKYNFYGFCIMWILLMIVIVDKESGGWYIIVK